MRHINVVMYLPDQMADWEVGYATAELATGRFLRPDVAVTLHTAGASAAAIRTMGGMSVLPDTTVGALDPGEIDLLILPGAESWGELEPHEPILELARSLAAREVPVAAICGATEALAASGALNQVEHTSNALEEIASLPGYTGHHLYRERFAVAGSSIITAGSWAPVEFAYEIFKMLDVMVPEALAGWHRFWGDRHAEAIFELMAAAQPAGSGEKV
ncbi:DJ-1/PfpI family protein [Arthrobacter castelli]|uniref:DJ-1/PfpI family protein n=1 Tax=Arthrobacter castelli TaxID=271431 RepID=UPI0003F51D2F|nr:DJ-1/PfpI family protein [Arthrobacter castelli]